MTPHMKSLMWHVTTWVKVRLIHLLQLARWGPAGLEKHCSSWLCLDLLQLYGSALWDRHPCPCPMSVCWPAFVLFPGCRASTQKLFSSLCPFSPLYSSVFLHTFALPTFSPLPFHFLPTPQPLSYGPYLIWWGWGTTFNQQNGVIGLCCLFSATSLGLFFSTSLPFILSLDLGWPGSV